jgi:transposase
MGYKVRPVRYKKMVLEYARLSGSVPGACRYVEVQRSTFYRWKNAFDREGEAGLIRKKPIAGSHPRALRPEAIEKVLHLRRTITWDPRESRGIWSAIMGSRLLAPLSTAPSYATA